MKRHFANLILSFLVSAPVIAQDRVDCGRDRLVGPVKTVAAERIEYTLADGKAVEGKRFLSQQTTYNEKCTRIETVSYDSDGKKLERRTYTYDPLGRNTGYLEFSSLVDKALTIPRKHVYSLDGYGRVIESAVFESDGSIASRFTYDYDAKGNKTEENFYSWNGTRNGRLVYTYDEAGHQLTQTSYDREGSISSKIIDVYDAEGRRIERTQYHSGILRYKFTSSYDNKERLTAQETLEFNTPTGIPVSHAPVPGKITYAYNDTDRTKEVMNYSPSGTLKSKEIHATDEHGNEISLMTLDEFGAINNTEIHWYDKNKSVRTLSGRPLTKFEYDAHGNWTKKTWLIWPDKAKEPEAYSAEYRTVTYF